MMGSCSSAASTQGDDPVENKESAQEINRKQDKKNMTEWKNLGYEVYKSYMGEEAFKKKIEEFEKPLPPPGLFDQAKIRHNTNKLKLLFGMKAFATSQRGTHSVGVGAQGIATIAPNPQFPACEFFTPGRTFPVCLRYATIDSIDDVRIDFCGGSLRFASSEHDESPFDIIMGTGPTTPLYNAGAIFDAVRVKISNDLKTYLLLGPDHLVANIGGLRHKPESFYDQRYYSKMIFDFKADDGIKRYVRFRFIPADGSLETGLLPEDAQWEIWNRDKREPGETLPPDYLKREFKDRMSRGPLEYKLQLQVHQAKNDDPSTILQVGREWDESTHPWMDLADIKMTSLLSPKATERLKFTFTHLPPCIGILPAQSVDDPNVVVQIRKEVYMWSQGLRSKRSNKVVPDHMASYLIRVETGSQSGAGTDATISISITGTKGKTDMIKLDNWGNDFERGDVDDYSVEAMDVGEILIVHLHNDGGGWWHKNPDWFVNKISIISSKQVQDDPFEFPCYRWVMSDLVVFEGKATLPFQELPSAVKSQRVLELQQRKDNYKWDKSKNFEDVPGHLQAATYKDIPRDSQFSNETRESIDESRKNVTRKLGLAHLLTLFESWDNLDDFQKILKYSYGRVPRIVEDDRWKTDTVFGWMFLNGCNPNVLERCEKLPDNFPVTEEMVQPALDRGLTFEQEFKEGHFYLANYKDLEGVPFTGGEDETGYTAEPLALFYVKSSGDLVPVAIQLSQEPGDTNPIWTPCDSEYDWLLAKMWLRNADYYIHQIINHILKTHLSMEAFAVAAWRQLPSVHPVFKLLFPHLRSVMAINDFIRRAFLKTDASQVLLKKSYKTFEFKMLSLPQVLKEKGVDDIVKLPKFYYRDDALCLWKAIETFIREVLSISYKSDDDVSNDTELQTWVQDILENGFPVRDGKGGHGFPEDLSTLDQLVHVLTCVVFTCSCQHAALNFGLMDAHSFVPFTPSIMRLPPPTKKNEATLNSIINTLPNKSQASQQIALMYVLSQFAEDERFLGDMTQALLTGKDAEDAISRFQTSLQEISDSIKTRNASLELPYINLLPGRIPDSIAI